MVDYSARRDREGAELVRQLKDAVAQARSDPSAPSLRTLALATTAYMVDREAIARVVAMVDARSSADTLISQSNVASGCPVTWHDIIAEIDAALSPLD